VPQLDAATAELARRLAAVVGARNCLTAPAELLTYEADGLTHGRTRPDVVVLPGSTEEVAEVVRLARAAGRPTAHGPALLRGFPAL